MRPQISRAAAFNHQSFKLRMRIEPAHPARRLAMDLNYVFLRQQVERSLAETAASKAAREAHAELARAYERTIERKSGGKIVFPWHRNQAAQPDAEQEISVTQIRSASS
jgi:hypothetical protein